jgi:hypothetical protein
MSAGGIAYVVLGIFFVGFFWITLGSLVDGFGNEINRQYTDGTVHVSQMKMDTFDTLAHTFWEKLPIVFILGFLIIGVVIALRDTPGEAY